MNVEIVCDDKFTRCGSSKRKEELKSSIKWSMVKMLI